MYVLARGWLVFHSLLFVHYTLPPAPTGLMVVIVIAMVMHLAGVLYVLALHVLVVQPWYANYVTHIHVLPGQRTGCI